MSDWGYPDNPARVGDPIEDEPWCDWCHCALAECECPPETEPLPDFEEDVDDN